MGCIALRIAARTHAAGDLRAGAGVRERPARCPSSALLRPASLPTSAVPTLSRLLQHIYVGPSSLRTASYAGAPHAWVCSLLLDAPLIPNGNLPTCLFPEVATDPDSAFAAEQTRRSLELGTPPPPTTILLQRRTDADALSLWGCYREGVAVDPAVTASSQRCFIQGAHIQSTTMFMSGV